MAPINISMKICSTCKHEKPLTEFFSNGYTPKGTKKIKPKCKTCEVKANHETMKGIFKSIVELKCVVCGYDRCWSAIEFHHLDPSEKDFGIRDRQIRNRDKLRAEIAKCAVLCSICHKEHHAGLLEINESHRAILKD